MNLMKYAVCSGSHNVCYEKCTHCTYCTYCTRCLCMAQLLVGYEMHLHQAQIIFLSLYTFVWKKIYRTEIMNKSKQFFAVQVS